MRCWQLNSSRGGYNGTFKEHEWILLYQSCTPDKGAPTFTETLNEPYTLASFPAPSPSASSRSFPRCLSRRQSQRFPSSTNHRAGWQKGWHIISSILTLPSLHIPACQHIFSSLSAAFLSKKSELSKRETLIPAYHQQRGRLCLRQPAEQMLSLRLHLLTVSSTCIPHVELKCINLYLRAAQTSSDAGRLEGNLRYFDSWVEVKVLEKQHKNIYSLHSNWARFLNLWEPAEWSFQWNHVWHLLTADKSLGIIKNISKSLIFVPAPRIQFQMAAVKRKIHSAIFRLVIQQQLIHVIHLGVTDCEANGRKVLHPDTELIVCFLCLISTDFYFSHH